MKLFLDDERFPEDVKWIKLPDGHWDIVRSYAQFVEYIEHAEFPEFIAFDHDLGEQHYKDFFRCAGNGSPLDYDSYTEKTGYDCAKWLVEYCIENKIDFPGYVVHSMNYIGKENIEKYISNYKRFKKQNI